jgi:ribosomal protein S18 acetylase RimI-like enzyme
VTRRSGTHPPALSPACYCVWHALKIGHLDSDLMKADSNVPASIDRPDVSLRPEQADDEPFLLQVYASTREEEMALTNWDATTRNAFLHHQFKAMRRGYQSMFPGAEFSVILKNQIPIGRMVIDRGTETIRVVDLAVLPAARGSGIGSHLMRCLQQEARASGKPICLQVFQNNRALRLYQRLGFQIAGQDGPYHQLQWLPCNPGA